MKQGNGEVTELNEQIFEFCRHIAGSSKVSAISVAHNYSNKPSATRPFVEVMLIINGFQPRLMSYIKTFNTQTIFVFAVDQWIFERDTNRGFLGEAIASKLIFPYMPLLGSEYLYEKEVALKKRLILELLENLVINFPELVQNIQIKPQYFMYEIFLNRIRVFPLLAYDHSDLMSCLMENESEALASYMQALKQLEAEEKIVSSEDYVKTSKKLISQCQDPKLKIVNLAKNAPRTFFSSIFGVIPQLMSVVSQNTDTFLKTQKINWKIPFDSTGVFLDPQKYVFFQTSKGLISLADRIDIKSYAQKMLLKEKEGDVEVERVGGMLNDVYVINVRSGSVVTKVFAKRFKDWSGFKWFPLTIWSFGARSFAVSAQARLAKECAISELLHSEGFNVPRILHVSNAERVVFMEYIEGENLSQGIKRVGAVTNPKDVATELAKISEVGKVFAKVHSLEVTLGDTKPENVLIKPDGSVCLIDFEQASKGGDRAWDVAVFLYYCGHYLQPYFNVIQAEWITNAFIEGYLQGGGNVDDVKSAGLNKYTRVFSIFTMPSTITTIANVCIKTEKPSSTSAK
jgi:tRNA A-37 threonylcarbamoyl transferase component Bud32